MPDFATRPISALPAGTAFSRYIHALVAGRGDLLIAREMALAWKNTPQVYNAFDLQLTTNAATAPGTTTDATWAKPLAASGIAAEALALLRGVSIVEQLESRLRPVPFATRVPRDDSAVTLGGWVTEGTPIPATNLAFSPAGPLDATKVAVIVALTKELVIAGTPATEATVRRSVIAGLAASIDQLFLLPTSAAAPGHPASITNGATEITSTGSSAAQIAADLASMVAAITTSGGNLVWVMRPTTRARVAGALGSTSGLPQTLLGVPVVASKNSPAQITLLDGDAILLATDDVEVSLSGEGSAQFDTTPTSPADASTVYASFFQQNLVGIRVLRTINWLRAVNGSVAWMTVAY